MASNGSGRGGRREELRTFVVYDIPEDKLRTRIADVCQDYGLERIQYSAFVGKLGSNRREELYLKLQKLVGKKPGKVMVMALCEKDVKGIREILNEEQQGAEVAGGSSQVKAKSSSEGKWSHGRTDERV